MARKTPANARGRTAPRLNDAIRAEIVVRHARWESPTSIAEWVKTEYGIDIGVPGVSYYDLDNPKNVDARDRWGSLFTEARAKYTGDVYATPTAHKAVRIRIRDEAIRALMYDDQGRRRKHLNVVLLKDLLEAQAREEGGMFTNKRVHEIDAAGALAKLLGCDPADLPKAGAES